MTKLVHGCSRCSSHSTTDTDSLASTTVSLARPTVDTSASASASTRSRLAERPGRRQQAEHDAGEGRVQPGLVQRQPQGGAERDVHGDPAHAGLAGTDDGEHQRPGEQRGVDGSTSPE